MTRFDDLEARVRVLEEKMGISPKDVGPTTEMHIARIKELVAIGGGAISTREITNDLGVTKHRICQIMPKVLKDKDYEYIYKPGNRKIKYLILKGYQFESPIDQQDGFVYLLRAPNGLYKIGQTVRLGERIKTLNNGSPVKLILIHTIKTDSPLEAERVLHDRFDEKRTRGEWFALNDDDVKFIRSFDYMDGATLRLFKNQKPIGGV